MTTWETILRRWPRATGSWSAERGLTGRLFPLPLQTQVGEDHALQHLDGLAAPDARVADPQAEVPLEGLELLVSHLLDDAQVAYVLLAGTLQLVTREDLLGHSRLPMNASHRGLVARTPSMITTGGGHCN